MIRFLSLATMLTALTIPAMAADTQTGAAPGTGATSTMSDQAKMPQMNSETAREALPNTSPNDTNPVAQRPGASEQQSIGISLSEKEALGWVDKPVYSSDGQEVGEVVEIQRDAANKVTGMRADVGGFLGLGETRVKLSPAQFNLQGDRVMLNLTAEQAKALPKVQI